MRVWILRLLKNAEKIPQFISKRTIYFITELGKYKTNNLFNKILGLQL